MAAVPPKPHHEPVWWCGWTVVPGIWVTYGSLLSLLLHSITWKKYLHIPCNQRFWVEDPITCDLPDVIRITTPCVLTIFRGLQVVHLWFYWDSLTVCEREGKGGGESTLFRPFQCQIKMLCHFFARWMFPLGLGNKSPKSFGHCCASITFISLNPGVANSLGSFFKCYSLKETSLNL